MNTFLSVLVLLCSVTITFSIRQEQSLMGPNNQCSISEFTCSNGKCINIAQFCDNYNNCGDASDEPRFCTRCNRTYYGNIGLTYNLELHRPKEDKIPYVCILTFTASGGVHGDIVQVTLESFTLGKFVSYTQNGCQDGYLQISEASRQPIGGMWCGQSWGPATFYSETRSLVMTVKLLKLSRDQSGYNFDFRMQYKVLSKDHSVVRYGGIKHEVIAPWTNTTFAPGILQRMEEINKSSSISDNLNNVNNDILFDKNNNQRERYLIKNSSLNINTSNNLNNNNYNNHHLKLNVMENVKVKNYTEPTFYLGDLIPGTYCSRIFSNCDKKACRLQSPNFPGIYPRNLTCYYAVRQHDVPPGKHAIITVNQPKGNLVWITTETSATATASKNDKEKFKTKINTWDECDNVQDYVTIYDGYTTRDPIILKFCGGGQAVPSSTSSGPELLVEFTTSPYGTFINPQQYFNSLNGFQLEVQVEFVDIQSPTYAKSKRLCEFWIRGTGHGILENPKHSIAPNTTCLYHMQGTEALSRSIDQLQVSLRRAGSSTTTTTRFKIWLSILKFDYSTTFGVVDELTAMQPIKEDCSGMLRIWDGQLREVPICKNDLDCMVNEREIPQRLMRLGHNHTNIMARFCRGTIPRSCDHGMLNLTDGRPCTFSESFISSSDVVTLELKVTESTVLRPLNFKIKYEFVDYIQDGLPIDTEHGCNRKFVSNLIEHQNEPTVFRGVRNVFMFGRGGAKNLKCIYRFEAQRGERIRIVVNKMMAGNRSCNSKMDTDIQRSFCFGDSSAKVQIFERPWHESIVFSRNCICNSTTNATHLNISYISTSRELELHFSATNMTTFDDPDTLNFEATFEFFKVPQICKDIRRKVGSEGAVTLTDGDLKCRSRPWLIEPSMGKYLYIRFRGMYLSRYNPLIQLPLNTSTRTTPPVKCPTKSRIVITTGEGITITACPLPQDYSRRHVVEVFSSGWHSKSIFHQHELSPVLSLELLSDPEDWEEYSFSYLELTRRPPLAEGIEDCQYSCPELQACVNASTWCDGKVHCPSGYDESFTHCSALLRLPAEILASIFAVFIVLCCGLFAYVYRKIKHHCRRSSVLQTRLKSLSSMDTAVFEEKDFIS